MSSSTQLVDRYTQIASRLAEQTDNQYDVTQILLLMDRYERLSNNIDGYTYEQLVKDANQYVLWTTLSGLDNTIENLIIFNAISTKVCMNYEHQGITVIGDNINIDANKFHGIPHDMPHRDFDSVTILSTVEVGTLHNIVISLINNLGSPFRKLIINGHLRMEAEDTGIYLEMVNRLRDKNMMLTFN